MGCCSKLRNPRTLTGGALPTIGTDSAVDDCLWNLAPPENRNLTKIWLRFVVSQVPKSEAPGAPSFSGCTYSGTRATRPSLTWSTFICWEHLGA
jgi:hypothetical protein